MQLMGFRSRPARPVLQNSSVPAGAHWPAVTQRAYCTTVTSSTWRKKLGNDTSCTGFSSIAPASDPRGKTAPGKSTIGDSFATSRPAARATSAGIAAEAAAADPDAEGGGDGVG